MVGILIGICAFLIVWAWPETTLFCIAYGILVLIGNAHPEFMGKLVLFCMVAPWAYAMACWIYRSLRAPWYHLRGLPVPVPPPSRSRPPRAIRGRIPRDLLLKSER